ncbi:MAG: flagellar biosynthetic protein FliR [Rhodospirillales bacterium]|jgi:flagellar biosynthetic protein FliR|nr:flagellar biosynthetic protein FliR [Rhodospirillales bacterium]
MLQDLLTLNVFGFFLLFCRVGTAFVTLPGFSAAYVSADIRLLMALAVSFVLAPVVVPGLPGPPATLAGLIVLILGEMLIGGFFGALGRIIMGALHTAGMLIAYEASLANAFVNDPIAEQQGSVLSGFLTTVGIVLVFVTDLHHLMLRAVADSYTLFVPGEMPAIGDFSQAISRYVADSFALAVQIASPFMVVGTAYFLMLGILGRLMPALPVFFFGLPIQIATQIALVALSLSTVMLVFTTRFGEGFRAFIIS